MSFISSANRLRRDRKGSSALEYGLMAALVALGLSSAAAMLGAQVSTSFQTVSDAIGGALGDGSGTGTTDTASALQLLGSLNGGSPSQSGSGGVAGGTGSSGSDAGSPIPVAGSM
jgi:pilus assembly protein Flp/PilA